MFLNHALQWLGITSLKGRLRFWFISLIALLVILASIPFYILGKSYIREEASLTIEKMINLQQLVIENWFEERMADIRSVSNLPELRGVELSKLNEALHAFYNNHPEFNGIVYVNENGLTEVDTTGPPGLDVSDRMYYQQALKGKAFITDVMIGRLSHEPIIIFSAPVYDYDHRFRGLVFGSVSLATINEIMAQFNDDDQETYLVNRDGTLITDSRQGQIGETLNSEIFEHALEEKHIVNRFYHAHTGETVLGDYRWVHQNQWIVIGEMNERKIFEPFYRMAWMFAMVVALVIVLGYALLIWVARQIEKPVHDVLVGTREIGMGNYEHRLNKDSYSGSAMELQELCENFNQMSDLIESHMFSIAKSEERFRMITEYSSDMITIQDSCGKYLYVSPAGKEILQYDDEEMIGRDSYLFIHPDDIERIRQIHRTLLETGYVVSTYRTRRKDGEYIWFESSIRRLDEKNLKEPQLIIISRNITERKLVEQQLQEANLLLQELSMKDGLAGVWNRRAFDARLEIKWSRALANQTPLSLILLDIDYFKAYNDTYGHQEGDDCIRKVATAIDKILKLTGRKVFRYGGEEFGILLPETDHASAVDLAERIRAAIADLQLPHSESNIAEHVTISLGLATIIPTSSDSAVQFIETADQALYKAKQEGRNRVCFHVSAAAVS